MTFEQQSQTEITMYNPELNDMNKHNTSAQKKPAIKKRVQMMDPDLEEEEDEEEIIQKKKPTSAIKRVVAPKE